MSSYPPNPLPGAPTFIYVSPPSASITFGDTLQLTSSLKDATGASVAASQPFIYSSNNSSLATVDDSGLVTAATLADPNALSAGGIVQVAVVYPYGGRTSGETMSATATITVTADLAKTQALVGFEETQYGPYSSYFLGYRVVPASAPAGEYPQGWNIASSSSQ